MNISNLKIIQDIIKWYEENNSIVIWILENIQSALMQYYSYDFLIEDIVDKFKKDNLSIDELRNSFYFYYDNMYNITEYSWLETYVSYENRSYINIVLSDYRVLNKIEKDIDMEYYQILVEQEFYKFKNEVKDTYNLDINISSLWRNWRHVCIVFNEKNYNNFIEVYQFLDDIKKLYEQYENNFIKMINEG